MAAKTPETEPAQDGDTKSPPAAAASPKLPAIVAQRKKAPEPKKKPEKKAPTAYVKAVKKAGRSLDLVPTETANDTKTPPEDAPVDDEDAESLPDHVQEQLQNSAEQLEKKAEAAYAAHLREQQSRVRIALANRRKKGAQCTYIGSGGRQHNCFPQNPTAHGRCSIHADSRSYAKCSTEECPYHTRSEMGICTKCQTRATAAENRAKERENRAKGLQLLLSAGAELPELDEVLELLATKREIETARAAVRAEDS